MLKSIEGELNDYEVSFVNKECLKPSKFFDLSALFKISYGLYVVTSNDGVKDNGLIVNTVTQLTSTPTRVSVTINKDNYKKLFVICNTL